MGTFVEQNEDLSLAALKSLNDKMRGMIKEHRSKDKNERNASTDIKKFLLSMKKDERDHPDTKTPLQDKDLISAREEAIKLCNIMINLGEEGKMLKALVEQ